MSQSSANLTLSGKTGPAQTMTTLSFSGINQLELNFAASRGTVFFVNTAGQSRRVEFDMVVTTTLTDTITSLVHALTIAGT
jgi:hypothetical protein